MTPSPENWQRGSKRRLNSEINKNPVQMTKRTTSLPGLQKPAGKSIEMGIDKGIPGAERTGSPPTEKVEVPNKVPPNKVEPKEVKLPLELVFGFENKKVKFISEEKLLKIINGCIMIDQIGDGPSIEKIDPERLKQELGI